MEISLLAALAQEEAVDVSLSQALLIGIAYILIFGISVFTAGLTAKRLDIFDVGYSQALWATVFKNVGSLGGVALLGGVPAIPVGPVLILVVAVLPIIVYRLVFQSTLLQAVIVWIVVLAAEVIAALVLVTAAMALGAWLDSKFDMPLQASRSLQLAGSYSLRRC